MLAITFLCSLFLYRICADVEYLVDRTAVRGIKVGEEMYWTLDLNGSYIIESVRINVSIIPHRMFRMEVNDTRTLEVCNEIFVEENGWMVIKCSNPLVIGRRLEIIMDFKYADKIDTNLVIDICQKSIYPKLEDYNFTFDSSDMSSNCGLLFDGDINTCVTISQWYNYTNWVLFDMKQDISIEALLIIGHNSEPIQNINILITSQGSIDFKSNESLCNTTNDSFVYRCNKRGSTVLLKSKIGTHESKMCEILMFGSRSNDNLVKESESCNFKLMRKIYATFTEEKLISGHSWIFTLIVIPLLLCFAICIIFRKKPQLWHEVKYLHMIKSLQANELKNVTSKKIMNGEMDKEFEKLPKEDIKPSTIALLPRHLDKNRFRNIRPFDDNIVKLEDSENDYINASFIRGFDGQPREYIATQGPQRNTLGDFWDLVCQYEVDVIVMLTQLYEVGEKCEKYWPDMGEAIFGKTSVTIVKEWHFSDYIRRQLLVKRPLEAEKIVLHMHFLSWNSDCEPQCFTLLDFREKVNSIQKAPSSPLLVHCSAGIGRTGTYIAIDCLIKQAEAEGKVSVYKCVKDLRLQRMNMVSNKKHYAFVYKTITEASMATKTGILCIDFIRKFRGLVFPQNFQASKSLSKIISVESDELYKTLKKINQTFHTNGALKSEGFSTLNVSKNRDRAVVASDDRRIPIKVGSNCNGYINAVLIQCHKKSNAHVLTQIPLPETRSDFWHMLWEHDIKQIFLLGEDKKYDPYWPCNNRITFDNLIISLTMEDKSNAYYIKRIFLVMDEVNDNSTTRNYKEVTQYHVTIRLWPEQSPIPANKYQFQKILTCLLNNQRVVFQCLNGSTRCGLAAAAMLMIDTILVGEVVDPFLACRYVLASRPESIPNQEQYSFLYELALEYIKASGKYDSHMRPRIA